MQVIIMKDTKSLNSTALNDIDSKIQHLFGLSSLEEFGRCCESELIDRFINNKIDYFLYTLWLDDDRTLVDEFSTIIKDLVEYDFSIAEEQMKKRLNIA